VAKKEISQIGGGKHKITGVVDVAMIQDLVDKGTVNDLVGNYGKIFIDECHHISAASYEKVIRQAKARYITGLSATVTRLDGHHPIIFMQCGPVRYRENNRQQAASRTFDHKVIVRNTEFRLPVQSDDKPRPGIQEVYGMLAMDPMRNQMIVDDVLETVQAGRSPVLYNGAARTSRLLCGCMGRKGSEHNRFILRYGMQTTRVIDG